MNINQKTLQTFSDGIQLHSLSSVYAYILTFAVSGTKSHRTYENSDAFSELTRSPNSYTLQLICVA